MSGLSALWRAASDTRAPDTIAVLADALLERGDPRGSFMQLLLHGDRRAHQRAADLLAHHREEWLGVWADLVVHGTDVWRHGLLVGFRLRRDAAPLPAPDHPAWRTIEQIDLRGTPLERVLPVFDHPSVPLRALHDLASWNDLQTLVGRPSPRTRLELVGLDEHAPDQPTSPITTPTVKLGTLRLPVGLPGGLERTPVGRSAPDHIAFCVRQARHRRLPRLLDDALALHGSHGVTTTVRYIHGGQVVLAVALGASRTAELRVAGPLPIGWGLVRRLQRADVQLLVIGDPDPTTTARLDQRAPDWRRGAEPSQAPCATAEFRATLSSWQVTRPLSRPRFNEYDDTGRRWVQLVDDLDGLLDSVASGLTAPVQPAWPPR